MIGQRGLWWLAAAWTATIYSTLYVARPAAEFLRQRNLLALTVWAVAAVVVVPVLAWALRRRPSLKGWAALAFGAAAFLAGVMSVSPVEVRLHFVEYGVLGGLFYRALRARGTRWAAPLAVVLTGAAGWIDEGIQYLLPNRWYGLEDVVINVLGGTITVVTMVLFERGERAAPAMPSVDPPAADQTTG